MPRRVRGSEENTRPVTTTAPMLEAQRAFTQIRETIQRLVAIEDEVLEPILITLLARGHALLEGIPGIGKTLLARTLAGCVHGSFHRVQFTNDLMPSDIVGSLVWRPNEGQFEFVEGPLFANFVLADEINRTSPRTLSCLLEAMENGTVTVEGRSRRLAEPFLVLATRNPIEFHGTFPVPEAALDRFLVRVELDYPEEEQELALYRGTNPEDQLAELAPILELKELLVMQRAVLEIDVAEAIARYAYRVAVATREHESVLLGASPRAAMQWLRACRARALLQGRDYVLPDDLKVLAQPVLGHRIFLRGGGDARALLSEVLDRTPVEL